MACINPDGTLTPTARTVIAALHTSTSAAELAQTTNLPIYRIRSTLRELAEAGLVIENEGCYQLTERGKTREQ